METLNKKIKNSLYALIVVGMMGSISACDNNRRNDTTRATETEVRDDASVSDAEVIDNDENAWMRERDAFVTTNRERATRIDSEIAERERDMEKLSGKSRSAMQESINSLKVKRKNLDGELNKVGEASRETWQDMKNGVSEASEELEKSWEAFEKEYGVRNNSNR